MKIHRILSLAVLASIAAAPLQAQDQPRTLSELLNLVEQGSAAGDFPWAVSRHQLASPEIVQRLTQVMLQQFTHILPMLAQRW